MNTQSPSFITDDRQGVFIGAGALGHAQPTATRLLAMDDPEVRAAIVPFARLSGLPVTKLENRVPRALNYLQNYSYAETEETTGLPAVGADHALQLLEVVGLESFQILHSMWPTFVQGIIAMIIRSTIQMC